MHTGDTPLSDDLIPTAFWKRGRAWWEVQRLCAETRLVSQEKQGGQGDWSRESQQQERVWEEGVRETNRVQNLQVVAGQSKDLGLYSEWARKPLMGIHQESDIIWLI